MIKHWDIKTRIIILALLPSIIITSILACYFVYHRYVDLQAQLQQQGHFIIDQLSTLSKPSLLTKHNDVLQGLVESNLQNPLIDAAAIFDKDGKVLAYSGPNNLRPKQAPKIVHQHLFYTSNEQDAHYIFSKAIMINNVHLDSLLTQKTCAELRQRLAQHQALLGYASIHFNPSTFHLAEYHTVLMTLLILLTSFILSVFVAWQVGRNISKPLNIILRAINKIKQGELSTRVNLHARGQIKILVDGINRMAAAMQAAQDEMQQNIEQATADLTESLETVEMQNIELDMARKEALEGSRVKSEFIANISHEIRTPMNSIIGFTDLLLDSSLSSQQRDYLLTMKKSASNLLEIINDILDFSKIEAGKLRLNYIPMDLRDVVSEVLQLLSPNAQNKQLAINSTIDDAMPHRIMGDPLRLKQVLLNLVNNAIKFTEQGRVEIKLSVLEEKQTCYVIKANIIDTGVGLSKQEQKQLFRAFGQADSTVRRKYGGTGLGLVISKKLITQMGGEIGVESIAGKGSNFWFTFVSEKSPSLDNAKTAANPIAQYRTEVQTCLANTHGKNGESKSSIRVLAVDDNAANLKLLAALLAQPGIIVDEADGGARALNLASKQKYDIILTDIQMPNIDGIEVTDRIRKSGQLNMNTPIIAISAHVVGYEKANLKQAGINDYIIKPIDTKKLYNLLEKWTQLDVGGAMQTPIDAETDMSHEALVDEHLAIQLAGGKAALAKELLGMLLERLTLDQQLLDDAYQQNDLDAFHQHVHKLHGACCYCGIPQLKQVVSDLETAIKNEQNQAITLLYEQLKQLMHALLQLDVNDFFKHAE